jgi:hypothetical protein
LLGEREVIP